GKEPYGRVQVDVAADEMSDPGDPQERGGVEDVGADDLRHRERVDEHHHEPEEGPAPDRGEADDEAEDSADRDGDHLVAPGQDEGTVAGPDAALDERFGEEAEAARDERGADRIALDILCRIAVV